MTSQNGSITLQARFEMSFHRPCHTVRFSSHENVDYSKLYSVHAMLLVFLASPASQRP